MDYMGRQLRHSEARYVIPAQPDAIFSFIDDHARFSSHMSSSSWMMGGGRMDISLDDGKGQSVGSHIRMSGKAYGIPLSLDEIVIRHDPPHVKVWETVGQPTLVVIGYYRMGIEIFPQDTGSVLRVYIDYDLPSRHTWLGQLFGDIYARWCIKQMSDGVRKAFSTPSN